MENCNLQDIPAFQLCCGCGMCAYLCPDSIEMEDVSSLGRRPKFDTSLGDGGTRQALNVCPGVALISPQKNADQKGMISSLGQAWGNIFEIWEVHAADPDIRYKGSSGGAITALSLYCLEQAEMAGVLHTVVDCRKPYLNTISFSTDRDSLLAGTGSRYSPASPCEKLGDVEEASGMSVIVGKPCDIAAVHEVRKVTEKLDSKIGLTIACFCAGTPSTNGTLEMLRLMGVDNPDDLASLQYRGHGWPGMTRANGVNREYRELTYEQSWGGLQKYRQWRCYICPDHTGEFADLAVGDPWYKEREQGDTGRSLVLVRTPLGKKILDGAIAEGYLVAEKKDAEVLPASQPNLLQTRGRLWGQLLVLKLLGVPCPDYRGFHLFQNWRKQLSFIQKVKSIIGTLKRVYVKKLKTRVYRP